MSDFQAIADRVAIEALRGDRRRVPGAPNGLDKAEGTFHRPCGRCGDERQAAALGAYTIDTQPTELRKQGGEVHGASFATAKCDAKECSDLSGHGFTVIAEDPDSYGSVCTGGRSRADRVF